ncbi:MAG: xanthine dehydrogenase family protein molybdopterin-binding subunit [Candidatus Tectomicrobia bacterium]|nr:xanthine dehydrogenase family protein molybdopterin-binding subunit [Candidatus Tectomicrobia bacterium]
MATTDWKWIGQHFPPLEDKRFVLGRGRYINDVVLPGMLHLATVPSPHAHARIKRIDTRQAEQAPGVVKVITGAALAEWMDPIPQNMHLPNVHWYPLAVDKARFAGEWVAAVIAVNRYQAEDAADLVDVEYEPLQPLVDPVEAMQPEAAVLHEAHGSNIAFQTSIDFGDVESAFQQASHVFEGHYRWSRHSGVPLETFGSLASWDEISGMVDVWASQQNPQITEQIARTMRIPTNKVRVHMDVDIGGSYGNKRGRKQIFLTCVASRMLERPVKFIEDRMENMAAGDAHGPDRIWDVKVACDDAGKILGLDLAVIDDAGAYAGRGAMQISKPITALVGPYAIGAVRYTPTSVLTCKTNQAPYNGFGQAPTNFAIERALDLAARELHIDRAEIRLRNFIQPDQFPYEIPTGATYDSGDYPAVMHKVLEMSGYKDIASLKAEARQRGKLLGVGVATCIEPSAGAGSVFNLFQNPNMIGGGDVGEGVRLHVDVNGNVTAAIGFQSSGQGHETTVTQLVCESLQVDPSRVMVVRADSTGGVPSVATTGSRMHLMMGAAVLGAAAKIKDKMVLIAAQAMGVEPGMVELRDGNFIAKLLPGVQLSFDEVAGIAYRRADLRPANMEPALVETYVFRTPKSGERESNWRDGAFRTRGYTSFAFAAHLPIVEVDPETFDIRFQNYYIVHDCGVQINPQIVEGLVYGGTMRGIDAALLSEYVYSDNGQLQSQTFMDHLLASAMEVPSFTMDDICTPAPGHPLGAKGAGEGGYMTAPAAIISAIEDALSDYGVSLTSIPMTPTRLYELVQT